MDYVCTPMATHHAHNTDGDIRIIQIGEITIMKDMTSAATTMMTEEEKAEVERQLNPQKEDGPKHVTATAHVAPTAAAAATTAGDAAPSGSESTSLGANGSPSATEVTSDSASTAAATLAQEKEKDRLRRLEQREKLKQQDDERRKAMEERVATLTTKMVERLRPFVEAKHPGAKDDPETQAFEKKMMLEAEDLKLESFGVEVRPFDLVQSFVV